MARVLAVGAVSAIVAILFAAAASAQQRSRAPSPSERTELAHKIKDAWRTDRTFSAFWRQGLHPAISRMQISRLDRHFAFAKVVPLTAGGKQVAETVQLVLIKIGAGWSGWEIFMAGSDFAFVCAERNAPAPILEILCG